MIYIVLGFASLALAGELLALRRPKTRAVTGAELVLTLRLAQQRRRGNFDPRLK